VRREPLFSVCFFANRALKPSNIYIQNNGSHVVVGDFCLPSVLSDLKTHHRPAVGQWFQLHGFYVILQLHVLAVL